ncbi:hypothetical protein FGLOB1_10590 [Fusarium globosum]|uniref:Azaphilone pigments biosynthesis cluster protein L N-terminal domain-containing protein n=1 Tax=Fusarium globosum TaxID=78864 RepID=A0A8H6D1Z5_9HYPO|nr:hypothetical protein FGLOB1_10590 [Fusarium globosum]
MADPLSITASILAVVGAAYTSAQGLYDLIDGLQSAPKTIADMKTDIAGVQRVLQSLQTSLKEKPAALAPIFERVGIKEAVAVCEDITKDFTRTMEKYTTHSKHGSFSNRDRLTVTFRKSKLEGFRTRLNVAKDTVEFAVTSAILATSSSTYGSIEDLKKALENQVEALKVQSQRLVTIEKDVNDLELDEEAEVDETNDIIPITTHERDLTLTILPILKKACAEALSVTEAQSNNTYQKFGDVTAEDSSKVGAGVAGSNFGTGNVQQEFGNTKAKNSSQAYVGRMDSQAFKDFWNSPTSKPDSSSRSRSGDDA